MKSVFEPGGKATVFSLAELYENAELWGKRLFAQRPPEMNNTTWEIVWYKPGAYSTPHYHTKSESVYYFDFEGGKGQCDIHLGWPLSTAEVKTITGKTLLYIPAYAIHSYSNTGDTEMLLVHSFSPPWQRDSGISTDMTDCLTGRTFTDVKEYADFISEICDKYGTFNDFADYVKSIGQY